MSLGDDLTPLSNLPVLGFTDLLNATGHAPSWEVPVGSPAVETPEATTVLALRYAGGVVMMGDRQATEGYSVAHRSIQKVFRADDQSAIAISGTAGLAIDLVRLFRTELEHYEKLEDTALSLEGKANYLARMIRGQLPMAFQGLVVVPLFCGYDPATETGRLYTFDVVGGRYEEDDFGATGSGSREARSYLRNRYAADIDEAGALSLGMSALVAAAEQDVATGGPDPRRGIYPSVVTIDAEGYREIDDNSIAPIAEAALEVVR